MGKIMLIVILVALAVVVGSALCGKNVFDVLKKVKKIKIPKVNVEKQIPQEPEETDINMGGMTIIPPVLHMYQLNDDGSVFYKHDITMMQMHNDAGEMVGVSVSHPGADSDGIILYGRTDKKGKYDKKDKSTYAALTVNTDAILIGKSDDCFYGEVINPNASVYVVDDNNELVSIPYEKQFIINDKTYVMVGRQWLYFSFPKLDLPQAIKTFGSGAGINVNASPEPDVPDFVKNRKKTAGLRSDAVVNAGGTKDNGFKQQRTVAFRFPDEE